MSVGSGQTRVSDLRFQFYNRALHPEWFPVRAHRRFAQAGWEADIRILVSGHTVLWSRGPSRLSEVLLGAGTTLPEEGLLFRSTVRQERSATLRPDRGVEYQTCFAVERLEPEVFAHLSAELELRGGQGVIIHHRPGHSRFMAPALSRIEVEARLRGLSIHAYHTFPDEHAIVRTQSLFEAR